MSKPKIEYTCNLCEHCTGMNHAAMLKHLEEVHHVPSGTQVTEQMMIHGDGSRMFFSTYHVTGAGVDLKKSVTCKREKTDPMYH